MHGQDREIKVDLPVGPLGQFRERLHVKGVRARPIGPIKLHAHTLEEAVHIDESPVTLTISGNRSNGEPAEAQIHVLQPFTYLMMKLFAFRDRKEGRLLVTADDDFLALAAEMSDHAGIAYWSKKGHFGQLILALDEFCFEVTAEEAQGKVFFF